MDFTVKMDGLPHILKTIQAIHPHNSTKRRSLLNRSISAAARPTILAAAKVLAHDGDSSGALADSLRMRAAGKNEGKRAGVTARVSMKSVRKTPSAIAKYVNFYQDTSVVTSGIRHGHLVEFGHKDRNGNMVAAKPFMYPAVIARRSAFEALFMERLWRNTIKEIKKTGAKVKL